MVVQNDRILFSYKLMDSPKGNPKGNLDSVTNRDLVYKTYLMNNTLKEYYIIGVGYPSKTGHILQRLEPRWDLAGHDICIRYSKIPDGFKLVSL